MRRLVPRQMVTLDLDGEDEGLDCQVRHVAGPVALLSCLGEVPEPLRPKLTTGTFCLMGFTHRGGLVGLRGVATTASEDFTDLAFVVADGVQVEERRIAERVRLTAPARISTLAGDGTTEAPLETVTADISLGGTLVARRPGIGAGPDFRLELLFGGGHEPVRCEARLVRATADCLGLAFIRIDESDHVRLARIIAAHQLRPASNAQSRAR
jgi:hypothetical protein